MPAMFALLFVFGSAAKADPSFTKPTRDVFDLCTWATSDRASVAEMFKARGWTAFRAPYPDLVPELVADGSLFHVLVDQRFNTFGLDTATGTIPDLQSLLDTISEVSESGAYDALLWTQEPRAFLILYDQSNIPGEILGCRYFSASKKDVTTIKNAIWDFDAQTHESEFGPSRVVMVYTTDNPPHKPLTGLMALLVKVGYLVDRPMLEPQLGAGDAMTQFHRFDEAQFIEDYGREPNVAFALEIRRKTGLDNP